MPKPKKKKSNIKSLRDQAWASFRGQVMTRDTDERGYCRCISCDKVGLAEEFQAGHFDHGKDKENYYNLHNCHAQCVQCNYYGGTKTIKRYTMNMIRLYGEEETKKIDKSKRKYWNNKELQEIIEYPLL